MPDLIPVLDKDTIARKIADVARQISIDYKDANLVLIGVLKGAFIFMADLIRQLDLAQFTIDFVRLGSYGSGSESSGRVRLIKDVEVDIVGKDVLIVEDIIDTGLTLSFLKEHLYTFGPKSVKTCTLIDKYHRRQVSVQTEYVCHTVDEGFLVGYGLDYGESYRNLPEIFSLKI